MQPALKTAYWSARDTIAQRLWRLAERCMPAGSAKARAGMMLAEAERLFRAANPHLDPRRWSNAELAKIASQLSGSVINVSGWQDADKEGRHYRDYFAAATEYWVSNVPGPRGATGAAGELLLDLAVALDASLERRFDTAFCHTVLEHLRDPLIALDNLAKLASRHLIIVVPFVQVEHYELGGYSDYFRFTPIGLAEHLALRGFDAVRVTTNRNPVFPTYVFYFGTRREAMSVNTDWRGLKAREEIDNLPPLCKPISPIGTFLR